MKRRPFLIDDIAIWTVMIAAGVIGALVLRYITHAPSL